MAWKRVRRTSRRRVALLLPDEWGVALRGASPHRVVGEVVEPELEDLEEPVVRLEPVDEPAVLAGTEPQRCRVSGVKAAAIADVAQRVQTSAIQASRAGVLMVWSLVLFAVGFGLYGLLRKVNSEDYWRGKQMDHPVYYPEGKCPKCGE